MPPLGHEAYPCPHGNGLSSGCRPCRLEQKTRYAKSEKGKASRDRYGRGRAGKAAKRRYKTGPKGRAASRAGAHHGNLRKYRITPDQFRAMHEMQEGRCAICREPETAQNRNVLMEASR